MSDTRTRRTLIVANQTAGGEHLRDAVLMHALAYPTEFTLLVPATPPLEGWTWSEGDVRTLAERRLRLALQVLRSIGVRVEGRVGDFDPVEAVGDMLRETQFDDVLMSTIPAGASRWLRQDLSSRIRRRFGLPVTAVTQPTIDQDLELDGARAS